MLRVTPADGGAEVTLGEPAFEWERIPLAMPMDTRDMPVAWDELEHGAAVNVGNPHIVFFVPIGRAHVRTPVTNAHLVCRFLLEKKKIQHTRPDKNNKK